MMEKSAVFWDIERSCPLQKAQPMGAKFPARAWEGQDRRVWEPVVSKVYVPCQPGKTTLHQSKGK